MSDLISRKTFKKQSSAMAIKDNLNIDKVGAMLKLIDSQPTAYDVDKVVKQLEEMAIGIPTIRGINMVINLNTAIEIVRNGIVK